MNESTETGSGLNTKLGLGALVALVVIGVGSLWLLFAQDTSRQLMPLLPSPTPPNDVSQQELQKVAFTQLNDNPLAYLNRSILVSGDYLPLEMADCLNVAGPDSRWALTADNLQLDTVGFERIVRLLPAGTTMTVQGIWKLYQGPQGCGKGPPRGSAWYLDVKKIIQPNPLIGVGGQVIPVEIRNSTVEFPQVLLTPPAVGTGQEIDTMSVTMTAESAILATQINQDQLIPTQTPLLPAEIVPSATLEPPFATAMPTNTADPSSAVPTSTPVATAVPTNNPGISTPTQTLETPSLPPTSTRTNGGGYPGLDGTPTLTPSATLDPYP